MLRMEFRNILDVRDRAIELTVCTIHGETVVPVLLAVVVGFTAPVRPYIAAAYGVSFAAFFGNYSEHSDREPAPSIRSVLLPFLAPFILLLLHLTTPLYFLHRIPA